MKTIENYQSTYTNITLKKSECSTFFITETQLRCYFVNEEIPGGAITIDIFFSYEKAILYYSKLLLESDELSKEMSKLYDKLN